MQLHALALLLIRLLIWLLILILGAPLNHDGRRQVLRSGHPRHGCRGSRDTAMDGRSRRAHGAMPDCGHAEPRRGTEWWGKSPFGYFWGSPSVSGYLSRLLIDSIIQEGEGV